MNIRIALSALTGSLLLTAAAFAGQAELDTIKAECGAKLGYSAEKCACIADKAGQQLNDTQQKFMIANITQDAATFSAMQQSMPADQMVATGQFMTTAPDQCN